jgi:hypothetical protein
VSFAKKLLVNIHHNFQTTVRNQLISANEGLFIVVSLLIHRDFDGFVSSRAQEFEAAGRLFMPREVLRGVTKGMCCRST